MGHFYQNPIKQTLRKIVYDDAPIKSNAAMTEMYD